MRRGVSGGADDVTVAGADVLTPGYDTRRVSAATGAADIDIVHQLGAKVLTDVELSW